MCVCLSVCVRKQHSSRRKARQFTCLGAKQAHRRAQSCWRSMYRRRRASYVQSVVLTTLAFIHILFTKYSILNALYSLRNIKSTASSNCQIQNQDSVKRAVFLARYNNWVHGLEIKLRAHAHTHTHTHSRTRTHTHTHTNVYRGMSVAK